MNGIMLIKTERLCITEFDQSMVESVHLNSLDEDNRNFVPDEVFETIEVAQEAVEFLMSCYKGEDGPFVYPIVRHDGQNIGYVQAVRIPNGWEAGYHIAKAFTGKGYATEAMKAFLPVILQRLGISEIYGICLAENQASCKVLDKCGFILEFDGDSNYQGKIRHICRYKFTRNI